MRKKRSHIFSPSHLLGKSASSYTFFHCVMFLEMEQKDHLLEDNREKGELRSKRVFRGVLVAVFAVCIVAAAVVALTCFKKKTGRQVSIQFYPSLIDNVTLNFAVESRIYPQNPHLLFVTMRGGGLTVWKVPDTPVNAKGEPIVPQLVGEWAVGVTPVEGQDRHPFAPDVLVVAGIGFNGIFLLNVTDPASIVQLGHANVTSPDGSGILHVKLYLNQENRLFALCSMGWTTGNYLAAVDVTNPTQPFQVGAVKTATECMEGVMIEGDFAFVGGFCSTVFASVYLGNVSDLGGATAGLVNSASASDPSYVQMVCGSAGTESDIFACGMWASPGGVAIFDAKAAREGRIVELTRISSSDLSYVNRVHMQPSGLTLLPLEYGEGRDWNSDGFHHGGVALVDLSNPNEPKILTVSHFAEKTRFYCGELHPSGKAGYLFAADLNALIPFTIHNWE